MAAGAPACKEPASTSEHKVPFCLGVTGTSVEVARRACLSSRLLAPGRPCCSEPPVSGAPPLFGLSSNSGPRGWPCLFKGPNPDTLGPLGRRETCVHSDNQGLHLRRNHTMHSDSARREELGLPCASRRTRTWQEGVAGWLAGRDPATSGPAAGWAWGRRGPAGVALPSWTS